MHLQLSKIALQFGKDYINPGEVEDGGLTHDHCRKWKSLQELQVEPYIMAACPSLQAVQLAPGVQPADWICYG